MEKAFLITENTDLEKLSSQKDDYDRFYFWDAYCEHNLFYFLDNSSFLEKLVSFGKKLTLTTPIISEDWLEKLKKNILEFSKLEWFEIVINDYWVFYFIKNNFPETKVIWWNFLSWQNKDPYLKIFKDKEIHKQISIDNDFYFKYLWKNKIKLIELYNTFQWFNVQKDYKISIYYPYVIYSINRYCATKLLFDKERCFSIIEKCSWCKWKIIKNMDMLLKMKTENSKNFFRWNKQFYENLELSEIKNIKRIIYNYDLLW